MTCVSVLFIITSGFYEINFRFQLKVYIDCLKLTQKVMIFNDFSMVTVKQNYYKIHFWYVNKMKS